MIDRDTASVIRLIGVLGLAACILLMCFTERDDSRRTLRLFGRAAALTFSLVYFIGVFASAESGAKRLIPRFP